MDIAEAVKLAADFLPRQLTEAHAATAIAVTLKRVVPHVDGVGIVVTYAVDAPVDGAGVGALADVINGGLGALHKQHPSVSKFRFDVTVESGERDGGS